MAIVGASAPTTIGAGIIAIIGPNKSLTVSIVIPYYALAKAIPKVTKAVEKRLADIRSNPKSVSFSDAMAVAEHYFGEPRISGSHHIFKMPWAGDPRINLQKTKGGAKAYQMRQLLAAIDKFAAFKAGETE